MLKRVGVLLIGEIEGDPALRAYGACLALVNGLTAFFWLTSEPIARILSPSEPAVCWPMFPKCQTARILSSTGITAVVSTLFVGSLINAMCFMQPTRVRTGYLLLWLLTFAKSFLILLDYRLIHNQHYMALWTIAVFLMVPYKRRAIPWLLVCFYAWAGLLKLTPEWISGEALYGQRPLGLPTSLIPASSVYVLVLELAVSPGILSKRRWIWWPALAQLLLFHIASWWVVGFFYPLLMFLLLAVIPLVRHIPAPSHRAFSQTRGGSHIAVAAIVVSFTVCQLIPRMLSNNPAITGEGRMFALHMFDAPLECRSEIVSRGADGIESPQLLRPRFVYPRISCDPLVHYHVALSRCRTGLARGAAADFDWRLSTRKVREGSMRTVVAISSFCTNTPPYRPFGHNSWIRDGP